MRDSISPLCRMVGSVLFAAACLASGAAPAQVSTTSPVPMTHFFVVQPVDVCTDNPRLTTDCAYINNSFQTVRSSPTGANTLVGFLDPATGMLAHRNIWSQIGLDFRQTPVVQYNSTVSQTLKVDSCSSGTTGCTSGSFSTLAQQPGIANGATPTFPRNTTATTMNMFFVKNICSALNPNCTSGSVDGFSALNGNGIAIANLTFFPQSTGRPDTPAHEMGHNFADDHNTFGAGPSTNLMTAGSSRTVPLPLPAAGSKMDQWVLQVFPNGSAADLLTVGASCPSLSACNNQQGATQLSGFLNASPQATTSLFPPGEEGASTQTAAARQPSNNPPPIEFFIDVGFADACNASPVCANASLAEVVIVLTQGKFDNSSGSSLQIFDQRPNPALAKRPDIRHGNGNDACEGFGPTTWCLDLNFIPGALTAANGGFLDFTIGTKPSTIDGLQGTVCYFWESPSGTPYYNSCADLSSQFGGLVSNSQMVNLAINPPIPLNFAGTPGNKPCTLIPPSGTCPDPTSSYTDDSAERAPASGER